MSTVALRLEPDRPRDPLAVLRACWDGTVPLELERSEYLYLPGEPSRSVFLVREGFVRLGRLLGSGGELTVDVLGAGEIFGEGAVLGEKQRAGLAQAIERSRVAPFPAATFESVLSRSPSLTLTLARLAAERGRRLEARALEGAFADCRVRLARILLEMADRYGLDEAGGRRVLVRLTHEELARLIGAARETVTPMLVELRREGLLDYDRRRLLLLDLRRLRALAAGP